MEGCSETDEMTAFTLYSIIGLGIGEGDTSSTACSTLQRKEIWMTCDGQVTEA